MERLTSSSPGNSVSCPTGRVQSTLEIPSFIGQRAQDCSYCLRNTNTFIQERAADSVNLLESQPVCVEHYITERLLPDLRYLYAICCGGAATVVTASLMAPQQRPLDTDTQTREMSSDSQHPGAQRLHLFLILSQQIDGEKVLVTFNHGLSVTPSNLVHSQTDATSPSPDYWQTSLLGQSNLYSAWPLSTHSSAPILAESTSGNLLIVFESPIPMSSNSAHIASAHEPKNGRCVAPASIRVIDRLCGVVSQSVKIPSQLHGKIWPFNTIGSCDVSEDDNLIVYIANIFEAKNFSCQTGRSSDLNEYVYEQDWGEQMTGCGLGRVYILDLMSEQFHLIKPLSPSHSYGQCEWITNDSFVVAAWQTAEGWLGLSYCLNRRSEVYVAQLPCGWLPQGRIVGCGTDEWKKHKCIWLRISSDDDFAAWSPLSLKSDDEDHIDIVYLSIEKDEMLSLAHNSSPFINIVRIAKGKTTTITSRRQLKLKSTNAPAIFPGIYATRLKKWNRAPQHKLLISSIVGPIETPLLIDTMTGEVHQISFDVREDSEGATYSTSIIAVNWPYIVFERSSPVSIPVVWIVRIIQTEDGYVAEKLDRIKFGSTSNTPLIGTNCPSALPPLRFCSAMYVSGSRSRPQSHSYHTKLGLALEHLRTFVWEERHVVIQGAKPIHSPNLLAVVLHGGPHSNFRSAFVAEYAYLALIGFDILAVNYLGSIGFGNAEVVDLLGNAGLSDVNDVAKIVTRFKNEFHYEGAKTVLIGGSHGGFLSLHLAGQFPSMFTAVSCRNPVTNMLSMIASSDIPDWCAAEALCAPLHASQVYDSKLVEKGDAGSSPGERYHQLCKLFHQSPIYYSESLTIPVLFGIGESDARVPPSQGIHYYKMLSAQGKTVKLLLYPNNDHRIQEPRCARDYFLNTAQWFLRYCLQSGDDVIPNNVANRS